MVLDGAGDDPAAGPAPGDVGTDGTAGVAGLAGVAGPVQTFDREVVAVGSAGGGRMQTGTEIDGPFAV